MLQAEQDEEEDYMYFRTDDGTTLCRFGTDGLTEKERVAFGFHPAAENFEDMRRRLGDPEVCFWISYEEYMRKKQTV